MKRLCEDWLRFIALGQVLFLAAILNEPGFAGGFLQVIIWFVVFPLLLALPLHLFGVIIPAKGSAAGRFRFLFVCLLASLAFSMVIILKSYSNLIQIGIVIIICSSVSILLLRNSNKLRNFLTFALSRYILLILIILNTAILLIHLKNHRRESSNESVLMYCVDGADWRIIDKMMERGEMPVFRRMIETGCRGDLIAEEPLYSPILWTTIISGRSPAEHGFFGYIAGLDATMIQCRRIWDIAEEQGKTCGAIQFLGLWPLGDSPSKFAVPSMFEAGCQSRPPGYNFMLRADSERKTNGLSPGWTVYFCLKSFSCGMRLSTVSYAAGSVFRALNRPLPFSLIYAKFSYYVLLERLYQDLFLHLYRKNPADLAVYYFPHTDSAGHLFLSAYEPDSFENADDETVKRLGRCIPQIYREADQALTRFRKELPQKTKILIVSDHGMVPTPQVVENGFSRIFNLKPDFAELLDLNDEADYLQGIDRIFIVPKAGSDRSYQEIMRAARTVHTQAADLPVFRVGFRYPGGEYSEDCPIEGSPGMVEVLFRIPDELPDTALIKFPNGLMTIDDFTIDAEEFFISGSHHPRGIIIASGPGIKSGERIEAVSHLDLVPTVLAMLKLPQADDLKGKCADIFSEEYTLSLPENIETYDIVPYVPIRFPDELHSDETGQAMKDRWRSLGYIK